MKKSILFTVLALGVVFAGLAQNKKGPAYKNAKASEKYAGTSTVLINENPSQFQGPEFKNFDRNKYEIVIIDSENSNQPDENLVASIDSVIYSADGKKEKIIYRKLDTEDLKGKNTLGLKGPAYKNYKPRN